MNAIHLAAKLQRHPWVWFPFVFISSQIVEREKESHRETTKEVA